MAPGDRFAWPGDVRLFREIVGIIEDITGRSVRDPSPDALVIPLLYSTDKPGWMDFDLYDADFVFTIERRYRLSLDALHDAELGPGWAQDGKGPGPTIADVVSLVRRFGGSAII